MPAEPKTADVSTYRDLMRVIRRKRERLGLSCEAVDDIAGLADRYMNKLENFESLNGRHLGDKSLWLVLKALDIRLVAVDGEKPRYYDANE